MPYAKPISDVFVFGVLIYVCNLLPGSAEHAQLSDVLRCNEASNEAEYILHVNFYMSC